MSAPPLHAAQSKRDIEPPGKHEGNLHNRRRGRHRPAIDGDDPEQHQRKTEGAEYCKAKGAADSGGRLIGDSNKKNEEEPASFRAGVVDGHRPDRDIDDQENQGEVTLDAIVKRDHQGPRDRTVNGHDESYAEPAGARIGVQEVTVIEVDTEGEQGRSDATTRRNLDDSDATRPGTFLLLGIVGLKAQIAAHPADFTRSRRPRPREMSPPTLFRPLIAQHLGGGTGMKRAVRSIVLQCFFCPPRCRGARCTTSEL